MSDDELLLTARWVLPVHQAPIEHGAVWIRGGRIVACGPAAAVDSGAVGVQRIDLGEAAILPGFVNVHAHLELTCLRGYLEDTDFVGWIRKLTETKYNLLDRDEILDSARWGVLEATKAGITTIGEVCDFGASRQALDEGGLRAVVFQEVFGPDPSQASRALESLKDRLAEHEQVAGPRIQVGVSPHAPYTVSPGLLSAVANLSQERGYPLCIHAAESHAESRLVAQGDGPFAEHLRSRGIAWQSPNCSAIAYLERVGVLRTKPLLVHCVQAAPDDIAVVKASGSAVAHCPKSNAKLHHGVAPVGALLNAGVRVGLGTDGVVSNNTCDLLDEARTGVLLSRARQVWERGEPSVFARPAEILRLLTLGGAEALRLEAEIGTLEVGKRADIVGVDLSSARAVPVHDVSATLVWSASASDVVLTIVDGEVLWHQNRLLRLDEEALRRRLVSLPGRMALRAKAGRA